MQGAQEGENSILVAVSDESRAALYAESLRELGHHFVEKESDPLVYGPELVAGSYSGIVCDLNRGSEAFLDQLAKSLEDYPKLAIIGVTREQDARWIVDCVNAGARRIIFEEDKKESFIDAAKAALDGGSEAPQETQSEGSSVDASTGLALQSVLFSDLAAHCERSRGPLSLILLKIDDFMNLSNHRGYAFGNELFRDVCQTARKAASDAASIYHRGEGNIALIFNHLGSTQDAEKRCEHLMSMLQEALGNAFAETIVTLSAGIAFGTNGEKDASQLLKESSVALSKAGTISGDSCVTFEEIEDPDLHADRYDKKQRLRKAVTEERIEVHFQPIVDGKTGTPCRVEALARWNDESYGFVPPDEFIAIAEEIGIVNELGMSILRKCVSYMQFYRERGYDLNCGINVSRIQFNDPRLVENYLSILNSSKEDPGNYTIEVTETASYDNSTLALSLMKDFQEAGFGLSIDDFGTGNSTLSQLSGASFEELKIDKSLVMGIDTPEGLSILKSIVEMARQLKMALVAEGVETEEAVATLSELNIDYFQGYYYSKPLPPNQLLRFLKSAPQPCKDNG